jgi:predicted nucleic acid-binding protein
MVETCYFIERDGGPELEASFLESFGPRRRLRLEPLQGQDVRRSAELVRQYADLGLGVVDASVIAVAERLKVEQIATLDRRHFTVVRPTHRPMFTLLPE